MLRSYEAIYDHGRLEWIDPPPDFDHARVVVVVEESPEAERAPGGLAVPNGDGLAALIEQWRPDARAQAVEKFGLPTSWQREQRRERPQPGRETA
jgi:hypothetical protein